jgi:4-hydroxy-tetrahydrodipicolinate reductase
VTPTPIVVCGAAGRMGRLLVQLVLEEPTAELVGAVEAPGHPAVGRDAGEVAGLAAAGVPIVDRYAPPKDSVTLDFTSPAATLKHLELAAEAGAGIVVGTTGLTPEERTKAEKLAAKTRAVIAPNMSVGVAVLERLVESAVKALGPSFDVEVVEIHHKLKKDSPSGTALKLGEVAADAQGKPLQGRATFGREGQIGARKQEEVGVFGVRGGDVVGDHTVFLLGAGERLELTHRSQSRECLARGGLRAALWLAKQKPGVYGMREVLGL